jgi:nucleoside-diphosphate-sugar epimerase
VKEVFKLLGREPFIIEGPLTPGSTQRRCPDIKKLQSLGYKPMINFEKGLPDLVKWYVTNINNHKKRF